MTVSSQDTPRVEYDGDGSETGFAFTFPVLAESDLAVYLIVSDGSGGDTALTLTTHYTVVLSGGGADGGEVTMVTAPASGETLIVERNVPATQETDFEENDPLPAETLEAALDRQIMLAQQVIRDLARTMRLAKGVSSDVSVELPTPEAGKVLAWNGDADGLVNTALVDLESQSVSSFMSSVLLDESAADARSSFGAGATGDDLFTAADYDAARQVLGLSMDPLGKLISGDSTSASFGRQAYDLQTEGAAATDDLATLTVSTFPDAELAFLRNDEAAKVVTVKDGTGNINLRHGDYTLEANRPLVLIRSGSSWYDVATPGRNQGAPWRPRGLRLSNNAVDADHDLDIAAGAVRDQADEVNLRLAASITKRCDANWAVGTGNGALLSGSLDSSSMYGVYAIYRSGTGVTDIGVEKTFGTPTLPTNYTHWRLIGAFRTDASANIISFTQVGNYFRYQDPALDVNDNTITGGSFETATLSAPPNCVAHIIARSFNLTETAFGSTLGVRTKGTVDTANEAECVIGITTADAAFRSMTSYASVLTDGSRQVEYATGEDAGTAQVMITTLGFTMLIRDDPV